MDFHPRWSPTIRPQILVFIGLWACAFFYLAPAAAQSSSDAATGDHPRQGYGTAYGEGLRHLAEGRYDRAVIALFDAYAEHRDAHIMALIIDAYDAMGHCDAAQRQRAFFERHHNSADPPALSQCQAPATLYIDCSNLARVIRIGPHRQTTCAQRVQVPADTDLLVGPVDGSTQTIRIATGEVHRLTIEDDRSPASAAENTPRPRSHVPRLPGYLSLVPRLESQSRRPQVPRLSSPWATYHVYETSDGLYRMWVRDSERPASSHEGPQVEMICPTDDESPCDLLRRR